ncbi:MAG: prepilin-type N-terminal cleavage/methylation domain-containing protein [Gemmatimonadetes bacterium]|nr:prepilin-type N-terminal cleavage/methylation domain-containing protein [Gemmatimonadota bacterium]NIO32342.1 prepilin-type N-terminal cleavage/methylation domain-containing protein [Gemmatimonadota bacterium]
MDRRGVTLVELLITMALMGLLAAIVTKAVTRKTAAAQAVLKSDLRNIAVAQEAYFSDHLAYADDIDELEFQASQSVDFSLRADATGWAARSSHELNPEYRCALYIGRSVEPYSPSVEEGKINCMPRPGGGGCSGG